MITDPIIYRLFEKSPETLFLLLGMPSESATAMAARYEFQAMEFKETSHRTDGVFLPKEAGMTLYFLEVQFYHLPSIFADVLVKAYTYLKQHDPAQPFCGVVLFAHRSLEPTGLTPYQPLLDAGIIRRFYVDELPELADAPLGLSILSLLRQADERAPALARELIARAKAQSGDEALRADLIELIETVIIYKLPHLSREEIQTMLQVHDIRETRVYQEGREEGIAIAIEKMAAKQMPHLSREEIQTMLQVHDIRETRVYQEGREEGIAIAIAKMAAKQMSPEDIAAILDLNVQFVRQTLENSDRN